MRDTAAEEKTLNGIFKLAGLLFLIGLLSFAVGTEIYILSFWDTDIYKFCIWQGVWAIFHSVIISSIGSLIKKQLATNGNQQ
jgi:hypothetical protein